MEKEQGFNEMQTIKRRMFAMRNGVIADTLRKAGSPFKIIFGLNLPQMVEIAAECGKDTTLGRLLWANSTTRESMLIAPMLMEPHTFSREEADEWVAAVPCAEVADILCHRLLRHTPYALPLALELASASEPTTRYTDLRLMCNIAHLHPNEARMAGERELAADNPATRQLATQLTEY